MYIRSSKRSSSKFHQPMKSGWFDSHFDFIKHSNRKIECTDDKQ